MNFLIIYTSGRDEFPIVESLKEKAIIPHQFMKNTIVFETEEPSNIKEWMDDLIAGIASYGKIQVYQYNEGSGFSNSDLDRKFQSLHYPKKDETSK